VISSDLSTLSSRSAWVNTRVWALWRALLLTLATGPNPSTRRSHWRPAPIHPLGYALQDRRPHVHVWPKHSSQATSSLALGPPASQASLRPSSPSSHASRPSPRQCWRLQGQWKGWKEADGWTDACPCLCSGRMLMWLAWQAHGDARLHACPCLCLQAHSDARLHACPCLCLQAHSDVASCLHACPCLCLQAYSDVASLRYATLRYVMLSPRPSTSHSLSLPQLAVS